MSTNFYADITITGNDTVKVQNRMHIGKTGSGTIVQGDWFESFADWKHFLRYNADKVVIRNEYEETLTLDELIERFESYASLARRRQFDFLVDHNHELNIDPTTFWLDQDGHTVCRGEFT